MNLYADIFRVGLVMARKKKRSLTAHSILTVLEKRNKTYRLLIGPPIGIRFHSIFTSITWLYCVIHFIVVRWWLFILPGVHGPDRLFRADWLFGPWIPESDAVILLSHQVQSTVILYCVSLYISVHSIVTWLSHVLFCYLA